MHVVLLKFAENKILASQFMDAHKNWIQQGIDDGVFLVVGSITDGSGGTILAHDIERDALVARVKQDPFVERDIVSAEIISVSANHLDPRLAFLKS
ncbi:YciI family protein [Thaumasiovibrio subtropicus]|uniref:YciI family protein n=1 Tax=Thaumasiovibrio subtropicus TaxID=1891207 RepID=UPI000B34EAB0|nr:hypothetical protein [Thaumasiovibrio subtropicus]